MLLKKYKESFSGGAVAAIWVYLRQWAVGQLPANPLVAHDTSARHLRDPAFLKRALRYAIIMMDPVHKDESDVGVHLLATRLRKHSVIEL